MISRLRGKAWRAVPDRPGVVVIDVAGVGYEVTCTVRTASYLLSTTAETTSVIVHTIVSENAIALFGFLEPDEKVLFRELLEVPKVGPKTALAILGSCGSPAEVRQWLEAVDRRLLEIRGVAGKTLDALAERFAR